MKLNFKKSKATDVPVVSAKKQKVSPKIRLHYIFTSIAIISFYVSIVISLTVFYTNLSNRIEQLKKEQNYKDTVNVQSLPYNYFTNTNQVYTTITNI